MCKKTVKSYTDETLAKCIDAVKTGEDVPSQIFKAFLSMFVLYFSCI